MFVFIRHGRKKCKENVRATRSVCTLRGCEIWSLKKSPQTSSFHSSLSPASPPRKNSFCQQAIELRSSDAVVQGLAAVPPIRVENLSVFLECSWKLLRRFYEDLDSKTLTRRIGGFCCCCELLLIRVLVFFLLRLGSQEIRDSVIIDSLF